MGAQVMTFDPLEVPIPPPTPGAVGALALSYLQGRFWLPR